MAGFMAYTRPGYDFTPYHLAMLDVAQKFARGEINRLMLFCPPQSGKSQIVSRHLPAWLLGCNPDTKIVGASYSADLSNSFNRDVQRIIDSAEYAKLFPQTSLRSSNIRTSAQGSFLRNADIFEIVGAKGFYKSVGIGGSLTGTAADVAIIDDPVKDAVEAYSETFRSRAWDWYLNVLTTRLHNNSRLLLTMTRWHSDDLAGRILEAEGDKWTVLSFPAIKEAGGNNPYDKRQEGEVLYPQKHSLERMLERKKLSERVFASLYQQRPAPEGGGIWKQWLIEVPDSEFPTHFDSLATDWDLAYTEKESNSASAYVTSGKIGNKMYICDVGWFYAEFPALIERMHSLQSPHYIENKASGLSAKQTLTRMGIAAIEVKLQGGDKTARAMLATPYAQAGMVYVKKSLAEKIYFDAKQGILNFPNGAANDLADTLAQAIVRQLGKDNNPVWIF